MSAEKSLAGVKVMVIDDSNTIRRSAEIFLLQAGCTVILATPGLDRWDHEHHPSYREVWDRVLPVTRDPYEAVMAVAVRVVTPRSAASARGARGRTAPR